MNLWSHWGWEESPSSTHPRVYKSQGSWDIHDANDGIQITAKRCFQLIQLVEAFCFELNKALTKERFQSYRYLCCEIYLVYFTWKADLYLHTDHEVYETVVSFHLHFFLFFFLKFSDYQNYIVNSCVKENPTMERSIALCNGISQWVQLMVLSRPTPQLRAEVFIKFIHVAQVS